MTLSSRTIRWSTLSGIPESAAKRSPTSAHHQLPMKLRGISSALPFPLGSFVRNAVRAAWYSSTVCGMVSPSFSSQAVLIDQKNGTAPRSSSSALGNA